MKKLIILAVLLVNAVAFSQTPEATLKTYMKEMSSRLKTIAAQSTDPKKNESSEMLTLDLVKAVASAQEYMPSTATDQAQKDLYRKMIGEVLLSSQELAQAFHSGDNTKASEILTRLSQNKKDGHAEFKN